MFSFGYGLVASTIEFWQFGSYFTFKLCYELSVAVLHSTQTSSCQPFSMLVTALISPDVDSILIDVPEYGWTHPDVIKLHSSKLSVQSDGATNELKPGYRI